MNHSKTKIRSFVVTGVLAALVFASSFIISIPVGVGRIHFGNIMCLLSGLLFGPFIGGFAAGFGSMLYDFTNPLFLPEFWITFILKFILAFVAGMLYQKLRQLSFLPRFLCSAVSGMGLYILLFIIKSALWQHYINFLPWEAVWPLLGISAASSLVNGCIAVAACAVLLPVLQSALKKAGLSGNKKQA